MSLLSEKFSELEADYKANVEALRAAAGLCADADATADALKAADPDLIVSPVATVCHARVSVRLLCWSSIARARMAIQKAGLIIADNGEGTLAGEACDLITFNGLSVALYVERPAVKVAA